METIHASNRPYLVIDLEATCDDQGSMPREETEIIEIGAVLVDAATLAPLGEWQSFVHDRNQFRQDGARHGVGAPLGKDHLNLKAELSRVNGLAEKLGLGQALRRAGLRFQGTAHRGVDDARNIARLLPFALGRVALPGPAAHR